MRDGNGTLTDSGYAATTATANIDFRFVQTTAELVDVDVRSCSKSTLISKLIMKARSLSVITLRRKSLPTIFSSGSMFCIEPLESIRIPESEADCFPRRSI